VASVKPISVSVTVARPRDQVFAFLDDLSNHELFCDHMLVDWTLSGPRTGAGAKARVRSRTPGPKQWADITVVEARLPERIVEQGVGAGGARRTQGTYTLEVAPDGGTLVRFDLEFLAAPALERALAPLTRAWLQRGNERAMQRLRDLLEGTEPDDGTAAAAVATA
jgi:uncharacterized protein YndB with AHSA1/START domain